MSDISIKCHYCVCTFSDDRTLSYHERRCGSAHRKRNNKNTSNTETIQIMEEVTRRELAKYRHDEEQQFEGCDNASDNFIPSDPEKRVHQYEMESSQVREQEETSREKHQCEALGYNKTVLLSTATVSETARFYIQRDRDERRETEMDRCGRKRVEDLNISDWHYGPIDSTQFSDDDNDDEESSVCSTDLLVEHNISAEDNEDPCSNEQNIEDNSSPTIQSEGKTYDNINIPNFQGFNEFQTLKENHHVHQPFVYTSLEPIYIAFLELLKILDEHKCDLKMFDDIVKWLLGNFKHKSDVLDNVGPSTRTTRSSFIKLLRETFERKELQPKFKEVTLPSSDRKVTLPVFDFSHQVADLICSVDPKEIKQPNFDPLSWLQEKEVKEYKTIFHNNTQSQIINDDTKFSHCGRKEYPPLLASLDKEDIFVYCKYNNGTLVLCRGTVLKIANTSEKSVWVKWDDNSRPWKVYCLSSKWRVREEGGWCESNDAWAGFEMNVDEESDSSIDDSNDDSTLGSAPIPSSLVHKKVKVCCEIDILDDNNEITSDKRCAWFLGTVKDIVDIQKGAYLIHWNEYKEDKVTYNLIQSKWQGDTNIVGSWKLIESEEDLNDVVNNGISPEDVDNTVAVDDLYTGSAMTEGIKRYVAHVQKPNGISHVRPLPINMFIDASHTDLHGSLKTTPISFSVGAFPRILRNKHVNNRNMGYLPNLQAGLGKYANSLDLETYVKRKKRRQRGERKKTSTIGKLVDTHFLLDIIFESFYQSCREGIVIDHSNIGDGMVLYIPFLLMSAGDAAGNNELSCHTNNCGNLKSIINYNCLCEGMDLTNVPPKCVPITRSMINKSLMDVNFAKSIGQHPVISSFHRLPLAKPEMGIQYILPKDILHVFLVGLYKKCIHVIHNMIGINKKNAKYKDYLDMLHQHVCVQLRHSSGKHIPKPANRFGVMDGTRRSGTERMGDLFALLACFHTQQGINLMKPFLERLDITHWDFVGTIELLLSYEAYISKPSKSRKELVVCMPVICDLATALTKYLPSAVYNKAMEEAEVSAMRVSAESSPARKKSKLGVNTKERGNGWNISKFHALFSFLNNQQRFGSGKNFDTSAGEEHHKEFVKYTGHNTSRQASSFTKQVSIRNGERTLVDIALRIVNGQYGQRKSNFSEVSDGLSCSNDKVRGMYTMELITNSCIESATSTTCKTLWNCCKKRVNKDDYKLHKLLPYAILEHARNHVTINDGNSIVVTGYTEAKLTRKHTPSGCDDSLCNHMEYLIRASPNYRGEERYDFCIIQIPFSEREKDDESTGKSITDDVPFHSFARVLGIIQFRTGTEDPRLHAVVECQDGYVDINELGSTMMHHFQMKTNLSRIKILPLSFIVYPLTVITNFMSKTSTHYIACMERALWSQVFSHRIQEKIAERGGPTTNPIFKVNEDILFRKIVEKDGYAVADDSDNDETTRNDMMNLLGPIEGCSDEEKDEYVDEDEESDEE
jgi:hypothetical protein